MAGRGRGRSGRQRAAESGFDGQPCIAPPLFCHGIETVSILLPGSVVRVKVFGAHGRTSLLARAAVVGFRGTIWGGPAPVCSRGGNLLRQRGQSNHAGLLAGLQRATIAGTSSVRVLVADPAVDWSVGEVVMPDPSPILWKMKMA